MKPSLFSSTRAALRAAALSAACPLALPPAAPAQPKPDIERDRNRARVMLKPVKDYLKEYYYDAGYRKLREFAPTEGRVDDMMKRARRHKALIPDLRGNGGGYEKTLQRMLGYVFDREVVVGEMKRRKESKPLKARPRGADKVFKGTLVVIVDSESGSAAELFARVVQLEKRGTVVGDRPSGAVMRSIVRPGLLGDSSSLNVIPCGLSATDADIVMADGRRLEHVGVTPGAPVLPTAADLRARRDPALARAVELAGGLLTPEEAGALFPPGLEK